jgi:hypothetical protein
MSIPARPGAHTPPRRATLLVLGVTALCAAPARAHSPVAAPPLPPPSDTARRATRADPDTLVLWDSVRVVALPQDVARDVSSTAPCFGQGPARACGSSVTIIFSRLALDLQGTGALAASHATAVEVPLTLRVPAGGLRMTHDLRFHVGKSAQSHVSLVVDAGGTTAVYDFPRGRAVEGDQTRRLMVGFPARVCRARGEASCRRTERVSLLVFADRSTPGDIASITLASDDVSLTRAPATRTSGRSDR